ncbi:MAG TPA: hypothetical protein VGK84_06290 [Candidatus Tumulicola sp.]|jgi:hypothetical protein
MKQRVNPVRFLLALAVLALSAAGCQGGSPSSAQYTPTMTGAAPSNLTGGTISLDKKKKAKIVSSCGDHVKIVVLGILECKFHESGYTSNFNITNDTNGLVGISPNSGDKGTTFTITALLVGSGYFLVEDKNGTKLKVFVKVTLL